MSTRRGDGMRTRADAQPRRVVASFSSYGEAEAAVDHLSDNHFPVERTAIVARGLHFVEEVTGRMTSGTAALRGAFSGAIAGALIGWLFGLLDWTAPIVASGWLALHGLWIGALVGALVGLIAYALSRGRRDFSSIGGMRADRYEVLVDEDVADEAARLLSDAQGSGRFTRSAEGDDAASRPDAAERSRQP
jgi:hypothetical protein